MRTFPGHFKYPVPENFSKLVSAMISVGRDSYALVEVEFEKFANLFLPGERESNVIFTGFPVYISYSNDTIFLYPAPDGEYELEVTYRPVDEKM